MAPPTPDSPDAGNLPQLWVEASQVLRDKGAPIRSCDRCWKEKLRCRGEVPCNFCFKSRVECTYKLSVFLLSRFPSVD